MAKFSIILPVRNGGDYVKQCVDSILAQTHPDFELLVLDNASSDQTVAWIQSKSDPRIRIYPSSGSLPIEENWARIKTIPRAEFMTMIGHDDLLFPGYLMTMSELIEKHPGASLYQTHFTYIDQSGKEIRKCKSMPEMEAAPAFLKNLLNDKTDIMGTGFMMRTRDYDKVGGIPAYPNLLFADFELWMELAGLGYKATAEGECFSFRIHQGTTSVSPDTKFQSAFQQFVDYLKKLEERNAELKSIILENAGPFLLKYCKGLAHRLLRTPKTKRGGLTVKAFVSQCREYGKTLELEKFQPEKVGSIRLAIILDKFGLTRSLFLGFKKLYPKPVLK